MKSIFITMGVFIASLFGLQAMQQEDVLGATVLFPQGGGTGTSIKPTEGQLLVGTSAGVYIPTSTLNSVTTTNLGITGISSSSVLYTGQNGQVFGNSSTLSFNGSRLGIGTNNPSSTAHIFSSVPTLRIQDSVNTGANTFIPMIDFVTASNVIRGRIDFNTTNAGALTISNFSGSPNGQIHLNTATVNRLSVSSGGNIGINSSTPQSLFSINSLAGVPSIVDIRSSTLASTSLFRINENGFVGFGTSTPSTTLDLAIDQSTSAFTPMMSFSAKSTAGTGRINTTVLSAGATGNRGAKFAVTEIINGADTGFGESALSFFLNEARLSTGLSTSPVTLYAGTEVARFVSGKVGIGTTTPSTQLSLQATAANSGMQFRPTDSKGYSMAFGSSLPTWVDTTAPSARIDTSGNFVFNSGSGGDNFFNIDNVTRKNFFYGTNVIPNGSKLGIGTTTPQVAFHLAQDALISSDGSAPFIIGNFTNPTYQLLAGYDSTRDSAYLQSIHTGVSYANLSVQTNGGNFGIASTTARAKLGVQGNMLVVGDATTTGNSYLAGNNRLGGITYAGAAGSFVNDANLVIQTIGSSAGVGISRTAATYGTFLAPYNSDTYALRVIEASNRLSLVVNSTNQALNITSAGNVGIATTSPQALLVVGNAGGSIADSNVPLQLSTGGNGTQTNFGLNKDGAYGFLFGYLNKSALGAIGLWEGSYFRNVTGDPFAVVMNSTNVNTMWMPSGDIVFGNNITNSSTYAGSTVVFKGTGLVGIGTSTPLGSLQVATSTLNATTTISIGKNSTKGTCINVWASDGTALNLTFTSAGAQVIQTGQCIQ